MKNSNFIGKLLEKVDQETKELDSVRNGVIWEAFLPTSHRGTSSLLSLSVKDQELPPRCGQVPLLATHGALSPVRNRYCTALQVSCDTTPNIWGTQCLKRNC